MVEMVDGGRKEAGLLRLFYNINVDEQCTPKIGGAERSNSDLTTILSH